MEHHRYVYLPKCHMIVICYHIMRYGSSDNIILPKVAHNTTKKLDDPRKEECEYYHYYSLLFRFFFLNNFILLYDKCFSHFFQFKYVLGHFRDLGKPTVFLGFSNPESIWVSGGHVFFVSGRGGGLVSFNRIASVLINF